MQVPINPTNSETDSAEQISRKSKSSGQVGTDNGVEDDDTENPGINFSQHYLVLKRENYRREDRIQGHRFDEYILCVTVECIHRLSLLTKFCQCLRSVIYKDAEKCQIPHTKK